MRYKIYKNSIILAALRIIEPMMAMALIVAISRRMGVESFGIYSFLMTLTTIFIGINQMGLHTLLVREVSKDKERVSTYLSASIFIGVCMSLILIVAMNLSKSYFNLTRETSRYLFYLSLGLLPTFATYSFESCFMAFEKMGLIFTSSITSQAIRVGVSLILIFQGYSLFELVLVILFSYFVSVVTCFILFQRYIGKILYKIDFSATWALIKNTPSFFFLTIVGMISARIDVLIITKMTDMVQVAIYSAAYKLFEMNMELPIAYVRATFPQVSRLYKSDLPSFREMTINILRNVFYYVLFAAIAIMVLASLIVYIIYGDKYKNSSSILQVLIIGLLPWGASRVFASILSASNHQRYDLISTIFATGVNVLLNILLIPHYGGMGAAIANSCSLFVFFILELWFVKKNVYNVSIMEILKQAIFISALGLIAFCVARIGWLFPFIALVIILIGIIIYIRRKSNFRQEIYDISGLVKNIINS